jgi:hypothetical protein
MYCVLRALGKHNTEFSHRLSSINWNLSLSEADAVHSELPAEHEHPIDDSPQHDKNATSSDEDEEFVYPTSQATLERGHNLSSSREAQPSPAQLESLYAAASSGDLPLLKRLFKTAVENGEVEPFGLANHASTRTGFTALHAAASRGYHDIAVWCKLIPSQNISRGTMMQYRSN